MSGPRKSIERDLRKIHAGLRACRLCMNMQGSAVHGPALDTPIMLLGQAPGVHEESLGRPFAYTAGKTLFKWLKEATGADEEEIRSQVYFSAVARCFPGKAKSGAGDRPPNRFEIESCRPHLLGEIQAIKPKLILAVGRLAIEVLLGDFHELRKAPLEDLVGRKFRVKFHGHEMDVIPLPHPSGVSRWPHSEIGKKRLGQALKIIETEFREHL